MASGIGDDIASSLKKSFSKFAGKKGFGADVANFAGDLIGNLSGSFFGAGMSVLMNKLFGGKGDGETDNWSHSGNGTDYATTDNVYTPAITKESVKIINFNNTFKT